MSPLFFSRKARKAAAGALQVADSALERLRLGAPAVDLGPARRVFERGRTQFRRRRYAATTESAKQAEELARLLHETHDSSANAISRLRLERDRMVPMGIGTETVDSLIDRASASMHSFVEHGGDGKFPAYEKAGLSAREGLELARERVRNFADASSVIREADRTLREFRDSNVYVTPEPLDSILAPATAALDEARDALSAGEYVRARERALQVVATLQALRQEQARASEALDRTDAAVRRVRAEGGPTEEIEITLGDARASLARGNPSEAIRLASNAAHRIEEMQKAQRSLFLHLRSVQAAVAEAEQWGFNVHTAREAIGDARVLLHTGRYDDARGRLEHARVIAEGVRERHRTVAARIADLRGPISILRKKGGPAVTDADALFARAEVFFDEGAYDDCAGTLDALDGLLGRAGVRSQGAPDPRTGADLRATDVR